MIKTLRKKFVLINMLLVFLVMATVFTATAVAGYRQAVEQSMVTMKMALDRREGQHAPTLEVGQKPPKEMTRAPVFVVLVAEGEAPRVILSEQVYVSEAELAAILGLVEEAGAGEGVLQGYNLRWMTWSSHGQPGNKIAFVDMTQENAAVRSAVLTSALSLMGALGAFFVISLFLSRWALRPAERAWEQQKRFVADASHELKTPLTVILANTGILLAHKEDTIGEQLRWVENTGAEAGRMKQLVDSLLFLAKADDVTTPPVFGSVNLSDLSFSTALAFESLAYEKQVALSTDAIVPDVVIQGDQGGLRQLLAVLLENGIKYAQPGTTVKVGLALRQQRPVLQVANMGAPLSKEEMAHIFDRFYRGDAARGGEGYGLGLSIAKSIADTHRAKIWVESDRDTGTCFFVRF